MAGIFLSYRREDSSGYGVAIYDRLSQHFGQELIFRDIDTMDFGVDFVEEIERAVSVCDVLIALIGRSWLTVGDEQGNRRLDDPEDFVRLEIETALKRNIRVVPALVGGATMPKAKDLPESLSKLARRHALILGDASFRADLERLIQNLEKIATKHSDQRASASAAESQVESVSPIVKPPENMILIPKGPFLYGEDRHREEIPYDYYMDIYLVTNQQYKGFVLDNGYGTKTCWSEEGWSWKEKEAIKSPGYWNNSTWNKPDHPVVGVSYYEAEAYAKWAGKRLPTEQEWEKAARGTDGREYPWGEEFDATKCNSKESGFATTSPVTKYANGVSPYGCYDIAGNVWEWCASWYDDDKDYRVLRGGSWSSDAYNLRTSSRTWYTTVNRNFFIGFRLVQAGSP